MLHAAYNDRAGVTAAFNLNLLARLNRELEATFDLSRFEHRAFFNPAAGRVEMHLVSLEPQTDKSAQTHYGLGVNNPEKIYAKMRELARF